VISLLIILAFANQQPLHWGIKRTASQLLRKMFFRVPLEGSSVVVPFQITIIAAVTS
jgi:hypothetical protein